MKNIIQDLFDVISKNPYTSCARSNRSHLVTHIVVASKAYVVDLSYCDYDQWCVDLWDCSKWKEWDSHHNWSKTRGYTGPANAKPLISYCVLGKEWHELLTMVATHLHADDFHPEEEE